LAHKAQRHFALVLLGCSAVAWNQIHTTHRSLHYDRRVRRDRVVLKFPVPSEYAQMGRSVRVYLFSVI
jgi:hypothetical protein